MNKLLLVSLVALSILALFPAAASARTCVGVAGAPADLDKAIVQCGQLPACMCELKDVFITLQNFYVFMVKFIALPLAGLLIVIGGVMLIVSGGNPGLATTAKNILKYTLIAVVLIFASFLIVDVLFRILGYTPPSGSWFRF